jgi:hypothetical protein
MEAMVEPRPLVLVWWNTSLSPLGKPRATAAQKGFGRALIADLFQRLRVDLLALGEVCSRDLQDIQAAIGVPSVGIHDASTVDRKPMFDTGVLYNRDRLDVVETLSLLDCYGKTKLKVGERLTILSRETAREMHVFVSHWPSRLHCQEAHPRRTEIGAALRRALDEIRSSGPDEFIVLMGDYNDDPCSPSLANHLLATRDRDLARENGSFLYNPFWRRLGESDPFLRGKQSVGICGTYYYAKGEHTRWHTFDQIIFSSAFLREGPMVLNEEHSQIIRIESIESKMRKSRATFDHLPVMSVIDIRRPT